MRRAPRPSPDPGPDLRPFAPGRLRTAVVEHRRLLAAGCAALAVLLAVAAVRRPADLVPVPVAATDLASGQVVAEADVGTARLPHDAVPEGSATSVDEVVGLRVAGPMRGGEVFTDARVLSAGAVDALPEGSVVSTLRLGDAASTDGLRVGDRVDVLAVGAGADGPRAEVVAEGAAVAALPAPDGSGAATLAVVVPRRTALELARVGLEAQLGVVATGGEDTAVP